MEAKEFPKDTKHRDIFVYTCERIAEPLKESGYKYRKSKNDIVKKDNDFTYGIYFRPHPTYGSTTFWVHFIVESDMLKKWRCRVYENEKANGVIISETLAYLTQKDYYLTQYDVSTFAERERVISEVISLINDYAIPFFNRFNNIKMLIEEVKKDGFIPHRTTKLEKKQKKAGIRQSYDDFIDCYLEKHEL